MPADVGASTSEEMILREKIITVIVSHQGGKINDIF